MDRRVGESLLEAILVLPQVDLLWIQSMKAFHGIYATRENSEVALCGFKKPNKAIPPPRLYFKWPRLDVIYDNQEVRKLDAKKELFQKSQCRGGRPEIIFQYKRQYIPSEFELLGSLGDQLMDHRNVYPV